MKKKKRLLSLLLSALLLLCLLPAAQSEGYSEGKSEGKTEEHVWDSGIVTSAPTCTESGVKTYTCTRCGMIRTESIPATGHTAVPVPGKAATCTEPGLTDGSRCSVCGAVLTAQQAIPAKGHTAVSVPGKAATCTEPGLTEGSRCSVCGTVLTAQQSIPASGHTWDSGTVTTEPGSLNPGKTTYTCTRCGAIQTALIPASGFSINLMRNYPPIPEGAQGLRIVQQPEDATLPYGGSVPLTVVVEGGVGDYYTYEWHCETDSPLQARDTLFQQAETVTAAVAGSYNSKKTGFASSFAHMAQNKLPLMGTSSTSPAYTFGGAIYEASQEPVGYDLNDRKVTTFTSVLPTSTYDAAAPGTYYCVVRDDAGNFVSSGNAVVTTGLYIAVQPVSRNIYGLDTVNLTCVAGGGSGPENQAYTWYDADGNLMEDQSVFPASKTGEYRCLVVDFKTDETVESDIVQVYSEEADMRPEIILDPQNVMLTYREDGQYGWQMSCKATTFDGVSEDLEYQWEKYGKLFGFGVWWPLEKGELIQRNDDSGAFRCKVTDTRSGAYVYSDTAIVNMDFTCIITGIERSNGYMFSMGYTIIGGSKPYIVKIYQHRYMGYDYNIGEALYTDILITTLTIQEPGHYQAPGVEYMYSTVSQGYNQEPRLVLCHPEYYIFVTDANGNKFTTPLFETVHK